MNTIDRNTLGRALCALFLSTIVGSACSLDATDDDDSAAPGSDVVTQTAELSMSAKAELPRTKARLGSDFSGSREPVAADGALTIDGIYLQGGVADDDDYDDADEGGRLWLRTDDAVVRFATLENGVTKLLSDVTVRQGTYEELRLVVSGGYIEVEDGDSTKLYATSSDYSELPDGATVDGQLRMPSAAQSGFKVKLPDDAFEIEGEQKIVLLSFDVSDSFGHAAGQSGAWVMHPVIRGTDIEFTSTVEIQARFDASATPPPVLNGEQIAIEDVLVDITDRHGHIRTLPFGHLDGDLVPEAEFHFVNPLDNPHEIDMRLPGVTFATQPETPRTVKVGSGEHHVFSFLLKAMEVQTPATGSLAVRLGSTSSVELPDGMNVGHFDCRLESGDGTIGYGDFTRVGGSWTAVFVGLDASETWAIDLRPPPSITVETVPELPLETELTADETTTVEIEIVSVESL